MHRYNDFRRITAIETLKVMGVDYRVIEDLGSIKVDDDWWIQFPTDDEAVVLISFDEEFSTEVAVDRAIRFCRGFWGTDLDVVVVNGYPGSDTTAAEPVKAVIIEK